MMRDQMKELTVLFPAPADPITLFLKRKVRTKSDSIALDLQNDYISFGYYRDINFVPRGFPRLYQSHLQGSSHRIAVVSQEGYEVE